MRTTASVVGFVLAFAASAAVPASAQPFLGGPWSGFYIGGHAGAAFNSSRLSFEDLSPTQDLSFSEHSAGDSFLGGVHAGYDWQMGGVLVGAEGDVSFAKDIDYLSSIRGRLGFPVGPFLLYGTGGAAFEGSNEKFTAFSLSPSISDFKRNINSTGWTAGGGIDYMMMPGVSLGAEGLYYDMGRDRTILATNDVPSEAFAVTSERNFAVVRARLTYHFGW
jgi:outer membrane immunogenic protein